jgi:hypothetical protein
VAKFKIDLKLSENGPGTISFIPSVSHDGAGRLPTNLAQATLDGVAGGELKFSVALALLDRS